MISGRDFSGSIIDMMPPEGYKGRSLSIGDVVSIGEDFYTPEPVGWRSSTMTRRRLSRMERNFTPSFSRAHGRTSKTIGILAGLDLSSHSDRRDVMTIQPVDSRWIEFQRNSILCSRSWSLRRHR